jgi:alpha-mannosidase
VKSFIIGCIFALSLCTAAQSAQNSKTVFQLGVFDGASNEFAAGVPSSPVVADAASADFSRHWFAGQPAVEPSAANGRLTDFASAARAIRFAIPDSPAAAYRLRVSLLIESRSVPGLRTCINGKCGMFYLDSPLDAHMGDSDDTFQSVYAPAEVSFVFPGAYLHRGSNKITFQIIEDKDWPVDGASLTYDAIELDAVPASELPRASSSAVVPTVFYLSRAGALNEVMDVYVRSTGRFGSGSSVTLTVDGKSYRAELRGDDDFGEQRAEFEIPKFAAGANANLEWKTGGKRYTANQKIDPQKRWTLFLVPHIHLDVGFSDYQPKVAAVQDRVMDEGMDFAERVPGFKFSVDGSWDLDQFMQTRSPADQRRAISAMKNGQLYVPAQYANLLTGFPTAETLIRSLYASANFSRLHGTPFNYANITDVPTYSWSYSSVLASAGIHYLIAGPNGHLSRGPVQIQGRLNEKSPFWWVGPDGSKVLFWYGRHYLEGSMMFGPTPEVNAGRETIPLFLKTYERPSYKADAAILYGTQVENTDLSPEQADLAAKWNAKFAYPKLQYSGFYDALHAIEQQFGDAIPAIGGDGGPYWEGGIAANAREAAEERQNESRAPSADKLATLSSLVNPRLAADKRALDRMWTNIVLMDEHTWTSHDSRTDPSSDETAHQSEVKAMYAADARSIADYVARNSMAGLADAIPAGWGSLIVFNTLNWKRSALVNFDLEKGREIFDPATGAVVPVQVVSNSAKLTKVRFMAKDVPAFGYKVFGARPSAKNLCLAQSTQSTILENRFYRVELDPANGAVRSIFDKQLGRELVNQQSPYRFGQYLYVSGGDTQPNTLLQYRTIRLEPKLNVDGGHDGRLLSTVRTSYGWVARMESTDTNTPTLTTEIRLFDDQKKIEFMEDIDRKPAWTREAVYFAFPFAMDHPQFQYEVQNGVVDPAKNMYLGAGHEWFSVQHWVSAQQDGVSGTVMPLDASLVTLGDIDRGAWPDQFGIRPGTIFSFVMNNYWSVNYDAQQSGHVQLRYVISSAASTDGQALSRMGWEEATPLESDVVTNQDKAVAPKPAEASRQASYLELNDPAMLVEDWKPAEDGNGTILRLLDLGGAERQVTIQLPIVALARAVQTDAVERDQHDLPLAGRHGVSVTVHPHEIVTIRLIENEVSANSASQGVY